MGHAFIAPKTTTLQLPSPPLEDVVGTIGSNEPTNLTLRQCYFFAWGWHSLVCSASMRREQSKQDSTKKSAAKTNAKKDIQSLV